MVILLTDFTVVIADMLSCSFCACPKSALFHPTSCLSLKTFTWSQKHFQGAIHLLKANTGSGLFSPLLFPFAGSAK